MGAARGVVRVRRDVLAARMTCPLCQGLLREATAITHCLHTCESSLPPSRPLCLSVPFAHAPSPRLSPPAPASGAAMVSPRRPGVDARLLAPCRVASRLCASVLVSNSARSLVRMPPVIGLVSDASSLIPGGWRTRRLSRGLWLWSRAPACLPVVSTSRRVRVCFLVARVAVEARAPGFRARRRRR
jgi:hypothetical protein